MKRVAWSIAYLFVGVVLSWQSMVWMSRLSHRLSWPLFSTRWHGCWNTEICDVSAVGYAFIVAFVFAPSAMWAIAGLRQTDRALSHVVAVLLLASGTVFFYLVYYAAVWR